MRKTLSTDKDGTFSDSTANEESKVWEVEAPVTRAYAIPRGAVVRVTLQDATATALPDGAIVRIYGASPDGLNKKIILEERYGRWKNANQYDKNQRVEIPNAFIIPPAHKLLVTVESSTAMASANSSIEIEVDEINMVTANEDVKKAVSGFARLLA